MACHTHARSKKTASDFKKTVARSSLAHARSRENMGISYWRSGGSRRERKTRRRSKSDAGGGSALAVGFASVAAESVYEGANGLMITRKRVLVGGAVMLSAFLGWHFPRTGGGSSENQGSTMPGSKRIYALDDFGSVLGSERKAEVLSRIPSFEFYGVVLDDADSPVSDCDIKYTIQGPLAGTSGATKSDSTGRFVIQGSGLIMQVVATKSGYHKTLPPEWERKSRRRVEIRESGVCSEGSSKTHSAVFRLRRVLSPIKLTQFSGALRVENGEQKELPLRKIGERLTVQIARDAAALAEERGAWKASIGLVGGQLTFGGDSLGFQAPEDGYQKELVFDYMDTKATDWRPEWNGVIWAKTERGMYYKMDAHIRIVRSAASLIVDGLTNGVVGERNFEPQEDGR